MKKGFTLIELLAVIVIVAIITLVAMPIISNVVSDAKTNALKSSAEGLMDAARLYNAQYSNKNTIRFDIENNNITSNDTDKLLKYNGKVKEGTIIIDSKGKSVICVTDGERSAYKNYSENKIKISSNKSCSVPVGQSIVYLENEATIIELNNQELTRSVSEMQTMIANLMNEINTLKSKSNSVPIGTIISYSTENVPEGYLKCEGQAVSRTEYAALFAKIGTTYGEGDGSTTFNVPDLRGEFLRGTGTNSHTNTLNGITYNEGSGAAVGVHQTATTHPYIRSYATNGRTFVPVDTASDSETGTALTNIDSVASKSGRYFGDTGSVSTTYAASYTGNDAYSSRPTNTSVLFCIKY